MKNTLISYFAITFLFFAISTPVFAGGTSYGGTTGCVPVYGGGTQCPRPGQVLLDKKVKNPASGIYVDNLGPLDPKYRPQTVVSFQITVKNPGDETISSMTVTDTLPDYLDYMSGPGTFDASNRKLTFTVTDFAGGASQNYEMKARVVHPGLLPAEKNVVCPVNVVEAVSNVGNDRDESQFCIEKVMDVPVVPKAGPEMALIPLLGSLFGLGAILRKKAV